MRNILISILAVFVTSCASYDFVPTPVPEEINSLIYTTQSPSGSKTWRITNNDLKVNITDKSNSGQVLSNRTIKTTPNDYNWVAYNLAQAKFTELKSLPALRPTQTNETLIVETQAETFTYTQNSTTRFPEGIQKVTAVIPRLF